MLVFLRVHSASGEAGAAGVGDVQCQADPRAVQVLAVAGAAAVLEQIVGGQVVGVRLRHAVYGAAGRHGRRALVQCAVVVVSHEHLRQKRCLARARHRFSEQKEAIKNEGILCR